LDSSTSLEKSPDIPYIQGMNAYSSRTFKSGNSEAIRLPKGLGFGIGAKVRIEREGDRLVLTPDTDVQQVQAELRQLVEDLRRIGAPADGRQERERFEFPERPRL
jgi:antitoxin VapB